MMKKILDYMANNHNFILMIMWLIAFCTTHDISSLVFTCTFAIADAISSLKDVKFVAIPVPVNTEKEKK